MALRIYTGAGGSKFVCDDDGGFGDAVAAISIRANAPINSCAREEAAEPFLRELGKKEDGEVGIHTIRAMRAMLRVQQAKAGPVEQ